MYKRSYSLEFVSINYQLINIFTKPLNEDWFVEIRRKLRWRLCFLIFWNLPKYDFQPDRCSTATSFGVRKAALRLGGGATVIECSSRSQKKATSHHMKTCPRKTQPWDIKCRPTVYAPLPPLPPEWTVVSSDADASDAAVPPLTP